MSAGETTLLTAEHVRARRRGKELCLQQLPAPTRLAALQYAKAFLDAARESVGAQRAALEARWDEVSVPAKDLKLAGGLKKLVEDRCQFDGGDAVDCGAVRDTAFALAAQARLAQGAGEVWDRASVMAAAADALGLTPEALEEHLFSDLREAQRLLSVAQLSPEALLLTYELGQAQAMLLRATKVVFFVEAADAARYRALFRAIKFRRLLCKIDPEKGGYCIEVDGPMSLFSSATKYGLALALLLPVVRQMDRWSLAAEVIWGRGRDQLLFRLSGDGEVSPQDPVPQPEEVERLLERWPALDSEWEVHAKAAILQLPGVGTTIPDLMFAHRETGEVVYLEVMGYWSRDAVWRRVELVEAGLVEKILFAVSTKLRVSEAVLDDTLPSALLVYKGTLAPKAVLEKLEALSRR